MREFAARGKTILFATHYLEEADAYADRIILLARGRVVADGPANEIKAAVGHRTIRTTLPGVDLAALTPAAAALGVPPGATYPLVGVGERFPFPDPDARGFDVGGPAVPTPAETLARVAHGVAYVERLAFDVLAGLGADVSGTVTVTGATSANDWWNQLRADVLGRPVAVPREAGSAFGAAVLAAAEPGSLAATAQRMVRLRARFDPRPERADALAEGCARLRAELTRERRWSL